MRKVFFTLGAIMLVGVGAAWYFIAFRLDSVVESRIERAATIALGNAVEVGGVHTSLHDGTLTVDAISIANPAGFENPYALRLNAVKAAIDYDGLEVDRLVIENPEIMIEEVGGETNFDQMLKTLNSDFGQVPGETRDTDGGSSQKVEPVIVVRNFRINPTRAVFRSQELGAVSEVEINAIELNNLRGTPAELAEQIGRRVLQEISSEAARELLKAQTHKRLKNLDGSVSGALHGLPGEDDETNAADETGDGKEDSGN